MANYCIYCGKRIDGKRCDCPESKERRAKLVEAAKAGDDEAFQIIYKETKPHVVATLRKYRKACCNNRDHLEDLLQEVYFSVYKSLPTLREADSLQTWVDAIARNAAFRYNEIDKKKNKKNIERPILFSEMENEDGDMPEFEDDNENNRPELIADRKAVAKVVNEILELLPAEQKEALLTVYGQKITIRELAASLGISENTVKSRLHQGKQKIMAHKADFKRLGVDLPAVGITALIAVAYEETISASAAVGTVAGFTAATGNTAANVLSAKEMSSSAATGISKSVAGAAGKAGVNGSLAASEAAASAAQQGAAAAAIGSSAATSGAAVGMSVGAKAVIGIVAASVIAGGAAAGKFISDRNNTPETVAETIAETTSAAESESVQEEQTYDTDGIYEIDTAALFGKTEDEIIMTFGEPDERYGGEGLYIEQLIYDNEYERFTAFLYDNGDMDGLKKCQYVYFKSARDAFYMEKATDIHNVVAAIGGKVVNFHYWTQADAEEDGDNIDRGMPGQTEVDVRSQHRTLYKIFLDDPNVVDPDDRDTFIFAFPYTDDYKKNKQAEFEDYLADFNSQKSDNFVQSEAVYAKKYYDLLNSLTEHDYGMWDINNLQWKYVDIDGDGTQELLFACGGFYAAGVGICTIVNEQAVYLGEYGETGGLTYYPGTGYMINANERMGGSYEYIWKLENGAVNTAAYCYSESSEEYYEDPNEVVWTNVEGIINGQAADPDEADRYFKEIENGLLGTAEESFIYGQTDVNHDLVILKAQAKSE